jgi:hypothetical protein
MKSRSLSVWVAVNDVLINESSGGTAGAMTGLVKMPKSR